MTNATDANKTHKWVKALIPIDLKKEIKKTAIDEDVRTEDKIAELIQKGFEAEQAQRRQPEEKRQAS